MTYGATGNVIASQANSAHNSAKPTAHPIVSSNIRISAPCVVGAVPHGGAGVANPLVRSNRTVVRSIDAVALVFAAIWPIKTSVELARRAGVSVRAAEYWLARRSNISADALASLLRSDAGLEVLEALIGDKRPVWWKAFKRQHEISALRRAQEQQKRVIERLEREAAD